MLLILALQLPSIQPPSCIVQDSGWGEFFAPYQEAAANSTDIVTITLGGQQHKLTVHDVSQLSMHQFAKIWTVSFDKLTADAHMLLPCLLLQYSTEVKALTVNPHQNECTNRSNAVKCHILLSMRLNRHCDALRWQPASMCRLWPYVIAKYVPAANIFRLAGQSALTEASPCIVLTIGFGSGRTSQDNYASHQMHPVMCHVSRGSHASHKVQFCFLVVQVADQSSFHHLMAHYVYCRHISGSFWISCCN